MKKALKLIFTVTLILTVIFSGTISSFGGNAAAGEVKVQLNGENFAFTNAAAKIVNGKAMVPFRQILEALGATVTYDPAIKTVSAKTADTEIVFTVGEADVKVIQNGIESIKTVDVAPFIDGATQTTYVPVRIFAESLGYCVGWDADEKTVILIDPAELFGTVDEDFSIIKKMLKADFDYEQAYKTKGSFDMELSGYELAGLDVSAKGEFSGIQQKSNADLTMSFSVDTDKLAGTVPPEAADSMAPIFDLLKNIKMDVKMDGESGTYYMHSDIFSLINPEADENTWYKTNIYEPYEEMGIDMQAFTRLAYSEKKLSKLLTLALSSAGVTDVSTYEDIKTAYAFAKLLIGDEAFRTKTDGNVKTHTLKINKDTIYSAMVKTALLEGIPDGASEPGSALSLEALNDLERLVLNFTIREKGGALDTYQFDGSLAMEKFDCSFSVAGNKMSADVRMVLDITDVMKMDISVKSQISKTSKAPEVNPPSGATVLEYDPMAPVSQNAE